MNKKVKDISKPSSKAIGKMIRISPYKLNLEAKSIRGKKVDDALSGQIVVALVDGEEATLKRLRKKGNTVALEPANPAYETKIYGPERIQIQGILVGILRSY